MVRMCICIRTLKVIVDNDFILFNKYISQPQHTTYHSHNTHHTIHNNKLQPDSTTVQPHNTPHHLTATPHHTNVTSHSTPLRHHTTPRRVNDPRYCRGEGNIKHVNTSHNAVKWVPQSAPKICVWTLNQALQVPTSLKKIILVTWRLTRCII